MKTKSTFIILLAFLFSSAQLNAQFWKKLKKRAEEAAKETVFQKAEEKAAEKTAQTMDSIFDAPNKIGKSKKNEKVDAEFPTKETENEEARIEVSSFFDFRPGKTTILYDDLAPDRVGDFPSKWDTNGSGEVVTINGNKWFRLANESLYIPLIDEPLTENYTITFDLMTDGLDNGTSSNAYLTLLLTDAEGFEKGKNWCAVQLSPCQFVGSPGYLMKYENGKRQLWNSVGKDYRKAIIGKSRISISVNATRMRIWLNENKIVDVPRLVPDGVKYFKMATQHLRDERGLDEIYISDFRIAETGDDLRRQLLEGNGISTNAILFESGSAILQNSSLGVIGEVTQILQENEDIRIKIIGHTDSDGSEDSNQELSEKRALAVKNTMVNQYGINETRIEVAGKGEKEPIANNEQPHGKSENRRVEFIKL